MKKNGGEVLTRHKVEKISKAGNEYVLEIPKKTLKYTSDIVVSNTTVWNTPKLLDPSLKRDAKENDLKQAWTAIIGYFSIQGNQEHLYHQIHFKNDWLGKGSFFYSFSDPRDQLRAPTGEQVVTVSTHLSLDSWRRWNEQYSYQEIKEKIEEIIRENFKRHFSHEIISKIEIGTPKTIERYTGRYQGLVGGIPHTLQNNLLTFPKQKTALENFYQIGDTTFPGQGIVGVTTGSLILAGKLLNKNFLLF